MTIDAREQSSIPIELLERYNVPGPRYTSYPTAAQFTDAVRPDRVDEMLASQTRESSLSLYFHVPFCRQLCWYCACTKIITRDQSESAAYVRAMLMELDRKLVLLGDRPIEQIHLGGGTPTFLTPDELRTLFGKLREQGNVTDDAEIAIEIDPRELSEEHIEAFGEIGVNRISLGVQDFNPEVQKAIHRVQSYELVDEQLRKLRALGIDSISFDLVYGLPLQSPATFAKTLDQVVSLTPERLAVYSYAHIPWRNPSQKLLERHAMPTAREKLEILQLMIERLRAEGYVQIGMDHFAAPTDSLALARKNGELRRNFQGYSTHAGADVIGLGMSSISMTSSVFFQNAKELDEYTALVEAGRSPTTKAYELSFDDKVRGATIAKIMCEEYVDFREISEQFGIDAASYFEDTAAELRVLEADGMLTLDDHGVRITELGRLFVRNIAMAFDAHLSTSTTRYSKTV